MATFEIKRAAGGKYMFNLKSVNDQVMLTSRTYRSRASAEAGIASVRQNASLDERYREKTGSNRRPYFVLMAGNNRVIGRSQMFSSREAMRNGAASVKRGSRIAETVGTRANARSARKSRTLRARAA